MINVTLFILTASFWSGSFIAIQPLVQVLPPFLAGSLRVGTAILFLSIVLPARKFPLAIPRAARSRVWLTGFFAFGLPFALLFWGEQSITAGLAGIINGTVPIWVFLLGAIFTPQAEPVTLKKITGLLLGIIGIMLIFLPKILVSSQSSSVAGALAVGAMAISYATGVLLNRSLFTKNPGLHPFTNLYQQLWSGFLSLLVMSFIFEGIPHPGAWPASGLPTVVISEVYLGCISTGLAFMMFYHLIRTWGSVRASTVAYIIPALTLVFDFVLNHRIPNFFDFVGVVAVTLGVVILNFRFQAKIR